MQGQRRGGGGAGVKSGGGAPESAVPRLTIKEDLEPLVEAFVAAHRGWLGVIASHRAAISTSDAARMGEMVGAQARCAAEVEALEARRRALVGLKAGERGGPTLTALAGMLAEPGRSRVVSMTVELRELVERVRREQAAIRMASASLLAHMRGVMTQVTAALSHAGVYGRAGRVEAGPAVVSSLDIRM